VGQWFQRAVRLPTRCLSVDLVFPAELDPAVWGTETSTTAEAVPLRTPITRTDRIVTWSAAGTLPGPSRSDRAGH
jgi:hypothetical protein